MLNNVQAIVVTLAHAYAPFAILPIFVALEKIDRSLLEAGQDLGETRLHDLLARDAAAGDARRGGGGADRVHPDHRRLCDAATDRRRQGADGRQPDSGAHARSRQQADGLGHRGVGDGHRDAGQPDLPVPQPPVSEGAEMKVPALRTYAYLYLLFLYAPIILLPIFAFNDGTIIAFPLARASPSNGSARWRPTPTLRGAVQNSLIIAVSASVLATTLGRLCGAVGHPLQLPRQGRHHRHDHAAAGAAGNHRGGVAAGGAAGHRRDAVGLHRHPRPCADLHALRHRDSQHRLQRARPQPEEAAYDLGETRSRPSG